MVREKHNAVDQGIRRNDSTPRASALRHRPEPLLLERLPLTRTGFPYERTSNVTCTHTYNARVLAHWQYFLFRPRVFSLASCRRVRTSSTRTLWRTYGRRPSCVARALSAPSCAIKPFFKRWRSALPPPCRYDGNPY